MVQVVDSEGAKLNFVAFCCTVSIQDFIHHLIGLFAMSDFEGFPRGTQKFLRDLGKNNNREWFSANKDRYEAYFLDPALSFINAMGPAIHKVAPLLKAEAKKSGGSLMRIYKDTRFSKDKTPYKTNIGIQFRHMAGKDVHAPGVYIHIADDECFVGVGIWRPPSDALRAIRNHIVENPTEWNKLHKNKAFRSSFELHEDRLKSAPRGFDKDHPHINDLRLKSFIGLCPLKSAELQSSELVPKVVRLIKSGKPLMSFLCEALNQPY